MALIECPECKKMISSAAPQCPNCGYPIAPAAAPTTQAAPTLRNCPECAGTGKVGVPCKGCDGDGSIGCFHCFGSGAEPGTYPEEACGQCGGGGSQPCDRCGGSGIDPVQVKCAFCKGGGQVTFEQFDARQEELKREQETKEAEAKRRAEEAAAEAARRYEEDAPRRAAAELRARKEANTLKQFIYACVGALLGSIPVVIMAIASSELTVTAALAGIIGPSGGAAIGLQIFFGSSKQCLWRSFLSALLAFVIWFVVYILFGIVAKSIPGPIYNILLPLVGTVIVALGAMSGGRKVTS